MNEKNLKREILENLKKGKSKTEIFEELSPKSDENELRRILASRPSPDINRSQSIIHKVICSIWVLIFITELLGLFDLIVNFDFKVLVSFAITTFLLIQLWKFNGDVFLPSITWLIWGLFNSLKELINLQKDEVDYDAIIIFSLSYNLLMIIAIVLTFLVRKNVFSYYNWFKPAMNDNNQMIFQKE